MLGYVRLGKDERYNGVDRFSKDVPLCYCEISLQLYSLGGRLLVSCVPMREQKKNNEKGYFFKLGSAQRCHHLG